MRTIIDMVAMTRFDCMVGSTAGQRAATVVQALHHCTHPLGLRQGAQPAAADAERAGRPGARARGSLALTMRMARALDQRADEHEGPAGALGHRGGQILDLQAHAAARLRGDGVHRRQRRDGRRSLPRLFREAPVNAIWEGSGNVQCLTCCARCRRRRRRRRPSSPNWQRTRRQMPRWTAGRPRCRPSSPIWRIWSTAPRDVVDRMALVIQAALLAQHAPAVVADALCARACGARRAPPVRYAAARRGLRGAHRARNAQAPGRLSAEAHHPRRLSDSTFAAGAAASPLTLKA